MGFNSGFKGLMGRLDVCVDGYVNTRWGTTFPVISDFV